MAFLYENNFIPHSSWSWAKMLQPVVCKVFWETETVWKFSKVSQNTVEHRFTIYYLSIQTKWLRSLEMSWRSPRSSLHKTLITIQLPKHLLKHSIDNRW